MAALKGSLAGYRKSVKMSPKSSQTQAFNIVKQVSPHEKLWSTLIEMFTVSIIARVLFVPAIGREGNLCRTICTTQIKIEPLTVPAQIKAREHDLH